MTNIEHLQRLEPYFAWITSDGFQPIDPPCEPGQKFMIAADVSSFLFKKFIKPHITYCHKMKTLWFDAMQADVAAEVHIITDDLSGLYVIFCAQNDPHYPCMLGKMDPEHETTKLYQLAFTEFLRNL